MTPRSDEDALSWEGDDDPTLTVGRGKAPDATSGGKPSDSPLTKTPADTAPAAEQAALPEGYDAVGKGSADVGRIEADGTVRMPGDRAPLSNVALVALGVVGGVYLLLTIGWVIGGLRLQGIARFLISDAAYTPFFFLAICAPALWFGAVWVLTRHAKPWVRFALLIVGAAILLPWPFIMVGAVG